MLNKIYFYNCLIYLLHTIYKLYNIIFLLKIIIKINCYLIYNKYYINNIYIFLIYKISFYFFNIYYNKNYLS